jgi:mycothiol S-conjugate amidase
MTASSNSQVPLRLLAVHAHPDDESSKGAATMAMYAAAGVDVLVATCTDGARGDIQNPAVEGEPHPKRDMAGARRLEMQRAAAILGIRQRWLGFVDSGLPEGDPLPPLPAGSFATLPLDRAAAPLVRLVRSFKPHVILSYDENGGYPHPDHVMTHTVSMAAFFAAGDPAAYPHAGAPWQPLKLYYNQGFSKEKIVAFHEALIALEEESPYADWLERWEDRPPRDITTRVHCADYFDVRDQALLAHATQIDPDGTWFQVPRDLQASVWPTEEYEAVLSYVPIEPGEDDLFAGIPDVAAGDDLATRGGLEVVHDQRKASAL